MGANSSLILESEFLNKYSTHDHLLGKGAFGSVYGPIKRNNMQLAIKQIMFADGKDTDEIRSDIKAKQQIWNKLDHKHLMKIYSVHLNQLPKVMYIVMEYAAGGSLDKTLRLLGSAKKLPIDVVTYWTKQIAEGMRYLNDRNIVHRGLKPSNILLMTTFDVLNPRMMMTLKIADFDDVKEHDNTITMSFVGTCSYAAPEVLTTQRFSKASDVWSFGVLIWEMLTGDIPHKGQQPLAIIARAQDGKLDTLPIEESFPEEYKSILNRCWETELRKRPSFDEIFSILQLMDNLVDRLWRPAMKTKTAEEKIIPIGGMDIIASVWRSEIFCKMDETDCLNCDHVYLDKYVTVDEYLSCGAFGNVYGPILLHGLTVAIKHIVFKDGNFNEKFRADTDTKMQIWNSLEHKNLTRIYLVDLRLLPRQMFIAMEFAAGGSLEKNLRSFGTASKLPIDVVTEWSKQIAEGMLYLHERNIVHRDLKSANILLMQPINTCSYTKMTLKIADFDDLKQYEQTIVMSKVVGTCAYMAPEVLTQKLLSKASDVWSYGVVLWEMISGEIPYKGLTQLDFILKVMSGKFENLPLEQSFPEDYKLLLKKCWESDHGERPTFNDIYRAIVRMGPTAAVGFQNFDADFLHKYATSDNFLNKGSFGSVHGPIELHGLQVAIKQIMFQQGKVTDEFKAQLEVKKKIWISMEHKHLSKIYAVDLHLLPKVVFIAMEYAAGGSLSNALRLLGSGNRLSIDVVTECSKQIAEGMRYLHENNIVHRDLKSSNILLMEHINDCTFHTNVTLKITDFDDVRLHDQTITMSLAGTCAYMAPEVLTKQWFSKASDVWSYGVVIWEMLSGETPHKQLTSLDIITKAIGGKLHKLKIEQSFPDDYKLLLEKCWESTHVRRPTFFDILSELERISTSSAADIVYRR